MKTITLSMMAFLFIIVMASAQKKYKEISFKKNEKTGAFMDLKNIESFFSYIPMQSYEMPDQRIVSVKSFYMLRFEIPNMLYKMFMNDLVANGKTTEFNVAFPDTNIWCSGLKPFQQYYYQHPAYNEYPVLGVSREGVNLFCKWLGEKIKSISPGKWKNKHITVRLPSEAEWMIAASGNLKNAVYAWKESDLRKTSGICRGDYMANFCPIVDNEVTRDPNGQLQINKINDVAGNLADGVNITAPVASYWMNGYGLYNMCGNVREMVQEEGFTKGGGWFDPGGELKITARNTYQKPGFPCEGFRVVVDVE